jgi:hypothetical protein
MPVTTGLPAGMARRPVASKANVAAPIVVPASYIEQLRKEATLSRTTGAGAAASGAAGSAGGTAEATLVTTASNARAEAAANRRSSAAAIDRKVRAHNRQACTQLMSHYIPVVAGVLS